MPPEVSYPYIEPNRYRSLQPHLRAAELIKPQAPEALSFEIDPNLLSGTLGDKLAIDAILLQAALATRHIPQTPIKPIPRSRPAEAVLNFMEEVLPHWESQPCLLLTRHGLYHPKDTNIAVPPHPGVALITTPHASHLVWNTHDGMSSKLHTVAFSLNHQTGILECARLPNFYIGPDKRFVYTPAADGGNGWIPQDPSQAPHLLSNLGFLLAAPSTTYTDIWNYRPVQNQSIIPSSEPNIPLTIRQLMGRIVGHER
jgi:hypothetical protein